MGNNNRKIIDYKEGLIELQKQLLKDNNSKAIDVSQSDDSRGCEWIKEERERRLEELKKQEFILDFIKDSGRSINNFFRGRTNFSREEKPYNNTCMYKLIDGRFIGRLINLSIIIGLSEPLSEDTVFYRGCIDMEKNGVNGLVTITSDYKIAEKYNKGTILAIVVPKGTRLLKIADAVPYDIKTKEMESEFLLPPCEAEIINESEKVIGDVSCQKKVQYKELIVTPQDLLEKFYKAMDKCPPEYENEKFAFEGILGRNRSKYYNAQRMLYFHITQRFKREEQIDLEGKKVKAYSLTGKHIFKPRKNPN